MTYPLILALDLLAAQAGVGATPIPGLWTAQVEREPPPPALAQLGQLTHPRTGTTCTMQVLRARPVDPRAARRAPYDVDPGIAPRGVSPCVE